MNFRNCLVHSGFLCCKVTLSPPIPLSVYCGKERKEITIGSSYLRGGLLGFTSLTGAYLHILLGILLGKIVCTPQIILLFSHLHHQGFLCAYAYLYFEL